MLSPLQTAVQDTAKFSELRARIGSSSDALSQDLTQQDSWVHLTLALYECGYRDADLKAFLQDLKLLGSNAFLTGVPPAVNPRGRAQLQKLVSLLKSYGLCSPHGTQKLSLVGTLKKAHRALSFERAHRAISLTKVRGKSTTRTHGEMDNCYPLLVDESPNVLQLSGQLPMMPDCACDAKIQDFARSFVYTNGDEVDTTRKICCFSCSGNLQVLALTAMLFITITSAQTLGAIAGHSKAMMADCIAMWVSCMGYIMSMIAEASAGRSFHNWLQVLIPALSLSTLIYFTTGVLRKALNSLSATSPGGDDDDVNPYIVLAFSLWGLGFDAASLAAFARNRLHGGGLQINMIVAFASVAADFCRSVATLVESLLILEFHFDAIRTDAWACIAVSVTILLGLLFPIWEWGKTVLTVLCPSHFWSAPNAKQGFMQCPSGNDCHPLLIDAA